MQSPLKLIIIDEVIKQNNPLAIEIWQKSIWLKEQSYRAHYRSEMLPLSGEDFFCTHVIVAEEGSLTPIYTYKIVTLSQCLRFGVEFPLIPLVAHSRAHLEMAHDWLSSLTENVAYLGSWSLNPKYKNNPEAKSIITMANTFLPYHLGYGAWIAAGVMPRNTHHYLATLGARPLTSKPLPLQIIDNQEVLIMQVSNLEDVSKEARATAQKHQWHWNTRLEFSKKTQAESVSDDLKESVKWL